MKGPTQTEKSFDCLAYKQRIQSEIYEEIKGLDFAEERTYFQRRAENGPLGAWWKAVKAAQPARAKEGR